MRKRTPLLIALVLVSLCRAAIADNSPVAPPSPAQPVQLSSALTAAGVFSIEGSAQVWIKAVGLKLDKPDGSSAGFLRILATQQNLALVCHAYGFTGASFFTTENPYPFSANLASNVEGKLSFELTVAPGGVYAIEDAVCLR